MLTTGFPRFRGDFYGSFLLSLSRALVRSGIEVVVVCPHDPGAPLHDELDGVEVRRFRYTFPSSFQKLAYGGGMPTNIRRSLLAKLEVPGFMLAMLLAARRWSRRCDLVSAQWSLSGWAASFAARPVVLTVRGSDLKLSKGALARSITGRAFRSAARIFTVSEDLRSEILSRGMGQGKVSLMPNGVDLGLFAGRERDEARRELGLRGDASIVLFAGQVAAVKNPVLLAKAAAELSGSALGPEFHIVGTGPAADAVRHKAAELGVSDRVFVHGFRPQGEMPAWFAAADVLALPSLSEGRPNVVLEAMAASRPVLATSVGGTPELVSEGNTGLLVPPGDLDAFTSALRRLLGSEDLCKDMGRAGRTKIEELGLSWNAVAAKHLEAYEEVLRAKSGAVTGA